MLLSHFEAREVDGAVERSALFSWDGGERRVWISVPRELAGDPRDASAFLPLALLPAMRIGEDVLVDGPVSPRLLRGSRQAAELYGAWAPELAAPKIEAAQERVPGDGGEGVACFYSRGVDSTYSAAVPRVHPGPIRRLLFVDGFDPNLDSEVMEEELRGAAANAERLGLPLAVLRTNVHDLTRLFVSDWNDMCGAALAFAALAAAGGMGEVVVASSDSAMTVGPTGSSPLIEPLLSTETTAVMHDSVALGRVAKCLWLARERPDLLPELKVCFSVNSSENCGRCRKCLLTMATLRAAGALPAARRFPSELDLQAVSTMPIHSTLLRGETAELVRELDDGRDPPLHAALSEALAQAFPPYPGPPVGRTSPDFVRRYDRMLVALLRDRTTWPPARPHAAPPGLGLVRAVDWDRGRHVYGVGRLPPGDVVGELGSLPRDRAEGLDSVYLTIDGHLITESSPRAAAVKRPRAAARWMMAPLVWRDSGVGLRERGAAAVSRALRLAERRSEPSEPLARVASIHRHDGPERVPIYSAVHPVTGDQLLATSEWEAVDLGYGRPALLGYADRLAPVTGRLGVERRDLPWASRFGRRTR